MAKYYTFITRDNEQSPWGAEFGDYDKECVSEEMRLTIEWDRLNSEYRGAKNYRVICTGDLQVEINARIAALNGEVA